jgi:simple sugar transport system permease protein
MSRLQKLFQSEQLIVFSFFISVCLIIGIINPESFFTANTLFDLLKNSTVPGILAISVLIIMIYGGVDLSFSAIGAFSSYVTIKLINSIAPEAPLAAVFLICILFGSALGSINALLVSYTDIPILVVTLGTSTTIYGFLLFFIDNRIIMNLPVSVASFSRDYLATVQTQIGVSHLHVTVLILAFIALFIGVLFRYMKAGRCIYATGGGGRDLAARVGVNVKRLDLIVFSTSGALAAVAGLCNAAMFRYGNPVAFRGDELDIIAAVVIGGASITGGKGSVLSTLLGVLLIYLIKNNLVMIGVPSSWQKAIIGIMIIIGTGYNVYRKRRAGTV